MNINDIRNLAKEKIIQTPEEKKKIDTINFLLKEDDIFFKIDASTAVGILNFLGIQEEKLKEVYHSLISPNSYKENVKEYYTTSLRK